MSNKKQTTELPKGTDQVQETDPVAELVEANKRIKYLQSANKGLVTRIRNLEEKVKKEDENGRKGRISVFKHQ